MKIILSFLLLFSSMLLPAQIVEKSTVFKEAPRGKDLFQLEGGLEVYTEASGTEGWYRATRLVYLPLQTLQADQTIPAGQSFLNLAGDKIGEALKPLKALAIDTIKGFRSDDRVKVLVEGFLFKTDLADGSMLEQVVGEILALRNRKEQQERWEQVFRDYGAEEDHFEPFDAFAIRKQHASLREPDDFRMIVIFRGSSIYAVMSKDHTVPIEKTKMTEQIEDIRILYFYKPSDAQREVIEEIMFTYLAL